MDNSQLLQSFPSDNVLPIYKDHPLRYLENSVFQLILSSWLKGTLNLLSKSWEFFKMFTKEAKKRIIGKGKKQCLKVLWGKQIIHILWYIKLDCAGHLRRKDRKQICGLEKRKSDLSGLFHFLLMWWNNLIFGLFTNFAEEETDWWQLGHWLYHVDTCSKKLNREMINFKYVSSCQLVTISSHF